jgi:hypothetical protein
MCPIELVLNTLKDKLHSSHHGTGSCGISKIA